MRVPLSWLRDFAPFGASVADPSSVAGLGRVMDDLGMVVEGIETVGGGLFDVVVSRVVSIDAIPGADRIRRVMVDAGGAGPVQVVCGAWNFDVGDLVPLAAVGVALPGGFTIGRRKMKGVVSEGMLCSGKELGLSDDAEGLLVLGGAAAPGTPLVEALGLEADAVYDLAIETNRPDAMCVAGVARDLAARLGLPFALPEPPEVPELSPRGTGRGGDGADPTAGGGVGARPSGGAASLAVDAPDLCPRFVARVLDPVQMADSPRWVARRLALAGMRPINSIVDASNYVMLELGQPTHPYDLDRLAGSGLSVRRARPGERLVTLDGVERVLGRNPRSGEPVDDCLICDADGGPVGVAGIMGGASSEIGPGTTRVLLEAAYFTPMAVARTSRRLGLRTEASARFERGCDPEGIERAVARFCQLAGGPDGSWARAWPGALAAGHSPARPRIRLRTARVNAILGTDLSDDQVRGYLAPIGFTAAPVEPGVAEVEVPSWRPDSEREIDLIEEVARHHGYGAIPRTRPVSPRVGGLTPYQRERRRVRATLVGLGASEAWTSSLVSPEDHQRVGLDSPGVELDNPLAREESVLRMTLLPGLLRAIDGNAAHRDGDVRLFEVGRVFAPPRGGGELPEEREVVALALARAEDDAGAAVSAWRSLAQALRLAPVDLEAAALPGLHPGRGARLAGAAGDAGPAGPVASEGPSPQAGLAGAVGGAGPAGSAGPVGAGAPAGPGVGLGVVGEVDPAVLEAFGLGGRRVGWLELDLGVLARLPRQPEEARAVSRYPSAEFDLAFVVEDTVPAGAVGTTLASAGTGAGGELVVGVVLFDVYRGDQLGPGRRSLAYRLRLAAIDHTLGEEELAGIRARCIEAVEAAHQARLRG